MPANTGGYNYHSRGRNGAMLNMPSLDIVIQGKVRLAARRLHNNGNGGRYPFPGHIVIEGVFKDPHLEIISDCITRVIAPDPIVHIRMEWSGVLTTMDRIWYTDDSKMSSGSGAGVYFKSPRVGIYYPLEINTSVSQAEIYAINACLGENVRMGVKNARIVMLSDSQAVIKVLSTKSISSALVKECLSNLNALIKYNTVVIGWVPGHKGVPRNEAGDKLARKGSTAPLPDPGTAIGIPSSLAKGAVHKWRCKIPCDYWYLIEGLKNSKIYNNNKILNMYPRGYWVIKTQLCSFVRPSAIFGCVR